MNSQRTNNDPAQRDPSSPAILSIPQWELEQRPLPTYTTFSVVNPNLGNVSTSTTDAETLLTNSAAPTQPTHNRLWNYTEDGNCSYEQVDAMGNPNRGSQELGHREVRIDDAYQRASIARREAQAGRKEIPPFIQKLNRFDPSLI
jgi:hypothetical protein